jgi:KaiC/GvpD/RAD55 family RecA-like ATPase
MNKINVVDGIMGSGKTSWAIQFMNEADKEQKFIYITPFLTEVERVKKSVNTRSFVEPSNYGKGKLDSLKKLILNDCNIVSTHALFKKADEEIIKLLKAGNYTLILDEVMDVVEQYDLNKDDLKLMIKSEMILVDEATGIISWNENSEYQNTRYDEIKRLSKTENLIYFENTVLFWTFPVSVFQAFEEVYVLTYLFEAQEQRYYYDLFQLEYEYKAVQRKGEMYQLVNHYEKIPYDKKQLKLLINIYEGKLNNIGDGNTSLSKSWYGRNKGGLLIEKMKMNLYTYFRNNAGTPSEINMWTCFKDDVPKLKGKGYSKGFVPHNARATNDYQDKESLAYTINRFMNPYKYKFFKSRGVTVNEEMYALSELIQWIWRSRIRKGEAINLYIPSKRMRMILKDYLESDI